ncbi:MAG: efflux transporter outer membrane subunit [Ottowia sp.]|nr:efflux transporter outer membrane subunit [Ottowia sp.]
MSLLRYPINFLACLPSLLAEYAGKLIIHARQTYLCSIKKWRDRPLIQISDKTKKGAIAALSLFFLSACTLAPNYERPIAPIAEHYPTSNNKRVQTSDQLNNSASSLGWNTFYTDPRLRALIALALHHNRDLRIASLNIEEAQAQHHIRRADLLPTLNAVANANRSRTPASISMLNVPVTATQINAGLSITAFELDLFGRVRSQSNAALAQYFATQAAQKAIRISLIAEIAKTYFNIEALAEQNRYAKRITDNRRQALALAQNRFDQGSASAIDIQLAQSGFAQARADEANFARSYAQALNTLTLLIGTPLPADLPAALPFAQTNLVLPLPVGLPSSHLTHRPDVMQAEFALQAAYANIGAARAAFFPLISLTGTYGSASDTLSGLFKSGSASWSFVPQLTLPIFDLGRNVSNLDIAHVRKNIAVAQYEKTVQNAFREVADALSGQALLAQQLQAVNTQAQALSEHARLSDLRLEHGISSALDQLDAQQRSDLAQQVLLQQQATTLVNSADIYKVLGGGVQD